MVINASITSWKHAGTPLGDQRPVLGAELVPAVNRPLPASVGVPSSYAVQSAAARDVKLDLLLNVMPAMLVRFGIVPAIGDRLTIKVHKHGTSEDVRAEIASDRPDATNGLPGSAGWTTLELKRTGDGV